MTYHVYDPANLLVGIYVGKIRRLTQKDTCTPMFPVALFAIDKTWKQPKFPSADDWLQKMWYMYTVKCYSVIKKNVVICSNMDGPRVYYISKTNIDSTFM